ncbi:hypothetical protein EX895_003638 [Sporisorium graminicola]|uniref:Uncharacterized protein n=1 Tax=Sporisorium graminicola TaxID=280036 RepID=A0A4U7KRA1_9BASI|nr:hypothetical protein EX895_003638 [Sporisorium graminicola]TKY86961.1 hypothetical protein EX895_003638 [Sporisorium graminicola]
MEPAPQSPGVPAESSNGASIAMPGPDAIESTPSASQPVGQTEVTPSTAAALTEAEPALPPTSASTDSAALEATSPTEAELAPAEAAAEPADAVSEQVAAPLAEPAIEASADEAQAVLDSAVSAPPTSSGPETASAHTTGDGSLAPLSSTAHHVSTDASNEPVPSGTTNQARDTASPIDPATVTETTGALQDTTAELNPATVSDAASAKAQDALSSAEEAGSTLAPSSISNNESVQPATEQKETVATAGVPSDVAPSDIAPSTSEVPSQQTTSTTEPTSTTAEAATDKPTVESSDAPTASTQLPQTQDNTPTQSDEKSQPPSTDVPATTEKKDSSKDAAVPALDQQTVSRAQANDMDPQSSSSSSNSVAAPPAVQAVAASEATTTSTPATPEKKPPADGASAAPSSSSLPTTPAREGRVALILRINKELIRLCADMQAKELTTDPVYREAAIRLQANLGYLASIADQAGKSVDPSARAPPKGALPRLEPFPRSEHAPSSPLPALFDRLISLFGAARGSHSPSADGKKRSRDSTSDLGSDDARKRAASKRIDRSPSAASLHQQQASANTAADSVQPVDASALPQSTVEPTSTASPAGQQSQQQQQVSSLQGAQQQQQGKGSDLSLAPPVPIAPPAAAQNIPNNPQAQALMQAFGPNALVNLHALQSHHRGQGTHPWVAFTEANVPGFKGLALQVQLQQMTSLQNAALQRQKVMQGSTGSGSSNVGSPATMQQSQQMMANGGVGGASSPATTRPASRHSDSPGQAQASPSASAFGGGNVPGRAGTPLGGQGAFPARPGSSGSVGSMTSAGGGGGSGGRTRTGSSNLGFDPSQLQSAPSPATMASMGDFAAQQQQQQPNFGFQPPGLQQGSPAAAGSPTPQQTLQQQQLQQQMGLSGMPNFQNLPPHLQQQIRQQYMAHMQAQAQAQGANPQQQFFQSPQ